MRPVVLETKWKRINNCQKTQLCKNNKVISYMFRTSRCLLLVLYQLQILYSLEWQWLHKRPLPVGKWPRVILSYILAFPSIILRGKHKSSVKKPLPSPKFEICNFRKYIKIHFPKIVICNLKWTCTLWMWIFGVTLEAIFNWLFYIDVFVNCNWVDTRWQ